MTVDKVKISEEAEDDKRNGQAQPDRAELGHGVGPEGVQGIGNDGGRADNGDQKVQKLCVILIQAGAGFALEFLRQGDLLVPPLAEREEQGQQKCAEQQPRGDVHVDGHRPGHRPQDKSGRNDHGIDQGHFFQKQRVGDLEQDVAGDDRKEGAGQKPRADQAGSQQEQGNRVGV